MESIRFSGLAEADLLSIGAYSLETWGKEQAIRYLAELESCCQGLAQNPHGGQRCEDLRPGLLRQAQGRHVIFFRRDRQGIVVCRILHQRMLPRIHAMEDG